MSTFEGSDQLKLANRANRWNTFVICRKLLWITQATEGYTILAKLLTDAADQAGPILLVFQVLSKRFNVPSQIRYVQIRTDFTIHRVQLYVKLVRAPGSIEEKHALFALE